MRGARNDIGTPSIVAHRLPRIDLFHQRNVFVRRSMKNHRRQEVADDLVDAGMVFHVADRADHLQIGKPLGKLLLYLIHRKFV